MNAYQRTLDEQLCFPLLHCSHSVVSGDYRRDNQTTVSDEVASLAVSLHRGSSSLRFPAFPCISLHQAVMAGLFADHPLIFLRDHTSLPDGAPSTPQARHWSARLVRGGQPYSLTRYDWAVS